MAKKYTIEEAKALAAKNGIEWTDVVEQRMRGAGLIADQTSAPVGSSAPSSGARSFWDKLAPGAGNTARTIGGILDAVGETEVIQALRNDAPYLGARYAPGAGSAGTAPNPIAEGKLARDQELVPSPLLDYSTARYMSGQPFMSFDVPKPTSRTQKLFGSMAQAGAAAPVIAGLAAGGAAALPAAGALSAGSAGGGMILGGTAVTGYGATQPAGSVGEFWRRVPSDFIEGATIASAPRLPVLKQIARIPHVGHDLATALGFFGINKMHGMSTEDAAIESIGATAAFKPVTMATSGGRARPKPKNKHSVGSMEARAAAALELRNRLNMDTPLRDAFRPALEGPIPPEILAEMGMPSRQTTAPEIPYRSPKVDAELVRGEMSRPEPTPRTELRRPPRDLNAERGAVMGEEAANRILAEAQAAEAGRQARIRLPMDLKPEATGPLGEPALRLGPGQAELPTGVATPKSRVTAGGRKNVEGHMAPTKPQKLIPVKDSSGRTVYEDPVSGEIYMTPEGQGIPPQQRGQAPATRGGKDLTLGADPFQAMYEWAAEKGRAVAAKRGARWDALMEELKADVTENPDSVPMSGFNRGEMSWKSAVKAIVDRPRGVRSLSELKVANEKMSAEQKAKIDAENLALLEPEIPQEIRNEVGRGFNKDVSADHIGFTDPVRKMQRVGDGYMGSAIEMSEIHGAREIRTALDRRGVEVWEQYNALREATGTINAEQLELGGRLLEFYDPKAGDAAFLNNPKAFELISTAENPAKMLDYVKGVRRIMDEARADADAISKALGGKGVGYIDKYFKKMAQQPAWWDLKEKHARLVARRGDTRERVNTSETKFNPSKLRRTSTDPESVNLDGREVPRNWNSAEVLASYLDNMIQSVGADAALNHSMKVARYYELTGHPNRANVIRNIAQQQWNHKLYGLAEGVDALFDWYKPTRVYKGVTAKSKWMFDQAKYRGNPKFSLVTQWTSVIPHIMQNPGAAAKALLDLKNPAAVRAARATFESRKKRATHTSIRNQAEGTGKVIPKDVARTKAAADGLADGLTNMVEEMTNVYSFLIDANTKQSAKYSPRGAALSAGQAIFKRQSPYSFGERAGLLNSRIIQGHGPAQSHNVEIANQIREALGKVGVDSKLYGGTSYGQKFSAGRVIAGYVLSNVWRNAVFDIMRGREPKFDWWGATMTLPPWIHFFIPSNKFAGGGRTLPAAQASRVVGDASQLAIEAAKAVSGKEPSQKGIAGEAADLGQTVISNWGGPGGTLAADLWKGRYKNLYEYINDKLSGNEDPGLARRRR